MILPTPAGWRLIDEFGDGGRFFRPRDRVLAILTSGQEHGDGRTWLHLSVSTPTRTPSFEQLRDAKEAFLGDRYAAQVFPPRRFWININPNVLHLWSTDDPWPLPEFGELGTL